MQLDIETIRWIVSGVFFLCCGLMTWAINRAVGQMDAKIIDHDVKIDQNYQLISDLRLNVATNYVSKVDLEKQLETHLSPIREGMQDIKDDIKTLLRRP